ncbi:MAG: right-handed parallel beta-helix repeat-containing protein [Candidatus Bathyarchaeota archaeon]|nr:MAG: right-handed parallel beta-helix repeat-containing protein [Candidatus Bathyarchaeota archaeon]
MKLTATTLILSLSCFLFTCQTRAPSYVDVTAFEAKILIGADHSLTILDVRLQSEYNSGHIRNALSIPLGELEARLDELEQTNAILVYCRSGGRSATASQILVDNSFSQVFNLIGGITSWTAEEYPIYVKYSSIQEAINVAHPGQSIYVGSGLYEELIEVNKTVSLIGENRENTIIDGTYVGTVVHVKADMISISDFKIRNSGCFCSGYSGIYVESNYQVNITGNQLVRNEGYGIRIGGMTGLILARNVIRENYNGIAIHNSNDVVVSQNSVLNNTYFGIYVSTSENSTVSYNEAAYNEYGVGISSSNNVTVFHNNFVDNTQNVYYFNSSSVWSNHGEGNYWSNYDGSDIDGDGIGDTNLPWETFDFYPLVNRFWSLADINHDLEIDIFDVVIVASAYGSTPADPDWNPHSDIAGPYGVIDIFDIVTVAASYGEVFIS